MNARDDSESADPVHPVRLVSARTGLSPHVLRVWERRYGAVHPTRSAGGQRLYSDADLVRLQLLRDATQSGRSIGQVVSLPNDVLRELIASDVEYLEPRPTADASAANAGQGESARILAVCVDAVGQLDPERLAMELQRAAVRLPLAVFADDVVVPLLQEIGARWARGELGPAQEHVASAILHRVLTDIVQNCTPAADAPAIVVGTPTGQRHELGALLVAACAAASGWRVIHLGADLPAAEIARAAEAVGADVVALSIVHPASDAQLRADLDSLFDRLPPDRQVVLGGSSAEYYARHLRPRGAVQLGDLAALREFLARRAAALADL